MAWTFIYIPSVIGIRCSHMRLIPNFLELAYKFLAEPSSTYLLFNMICTGSGETERICCLAWFFAARICDLIPKFLELDYEKWLSLHLHPVFLVLFSKALVRMRKCAISSDEYDEMNNGGGGGAIHHYSFLYITKVNPTSRSTCDFQTLILTFRISWRTALSFIVLRTELVHLYTDNLSCADPEGDRGSRPTPPPGKSQVIWVSIEIIIRTPPLEKVGSPTSWKMLAPL